MSIISGNGVLPPGETLEGTKQMFYLGTAPVGTEYANQAAPGALLTNTATLAIYENQGTLAVPIWAQISTV